MSVVESPTKLLIPSEVTSVDLVVVVPLSMGRVLTLFEMSLLIVVVRGVVGVNSVVSRLDVCVRAVVRNRRRRKGLPRWAMVVVVPPGYWRGWGAGESANTDQVAAGCPTYGSLGCHRRGLTVGFPRYQPPTPGLDKMVITVITDHGKF